MRSLGSILGSCALTLLICVWQAIHFDLGDPFAPRFWQYVMLGLLSFFAPEGMVSFAAHGWVKARNQVILFRGMLSLTASVQCPT